MKRIDCGVMDDDQMITEVNEQIWKILRPYANFVNDNLQRDSFIISDELLGDIGLWCAGSGSDSNRSE